MCGAAAVEAGAGDRLAVGDEGGGADVRAAWGDAGAGAAGLGDAEPEAPAPDGVDGSGRTGELAARCGAGPAPVPVRGTSAKALVAGRATGGGEAGDPETGDDDGGDGVLPGVPLAGASASDGLSSPR